MNPKTMTGRAGQIAVELVRWILVFTTGCSASADSGEQDWPDGNSGPGWVTYSVADRVYRIGVDSGDGPIDVSAVFDETSEGVDDEPAASRNGRWLLVNSGRFRRECAGGTCLVRYRGDLTEPEPVLAGGVAISPDSRAAISDSGELVIYSSEGEHGDDLFAVTRGPDGWSTPVLLTVDSPHEFNVRPVLSRAGDLVLFDCGPSPFSGEGNGICEAAIDGSGFRRVLDPAQPPDGISPGLVVEHGDYMRDGTIVFEADWDGEAIWMLAPGAAEPVRISAEFSNDNTPCVLPDDRIASLWLGRPGGGALHELKVMAADGSDSTVVTPGVDVMDIGLSCHRAVDE